MLLKFFSRVVHGQLARVDDSASPCHPLVHALTCSPVQAQWLGSKLRIKLDFFLPILALTPSFAAWVAWLGLLFISYMELLNHANYCDWLHFYLPR